MEHRVELTFTEIERVHLLGKDVAAAHIFFTDAGGQKYALLMGIGGTLWRFWKLGEQADEAVEKIVFQAAEEYIDEMIWKGELQEMIPKNHMLHEKVYGRDDEEPEQCPYAPDQSLPQFRVFWRLREDMPRSKQERCEFLLRLCELGEKYPGEAFKDRWVGRQVGLKSETSTSIRESLYDGGLVTYKHRRRAMGDEGIPVRIISDGIEEAEEYQAGLEQSEINRGNSSARKAASPPSADFYMTCDNLHEKVKERCLDLFEQDKYDESILNAMKVVEVGIRSKAGLEESHIGLSLIGKAMDKKDPILRFSDNSSEQEAAHLLFRGAIGSFKNPQSHRFLDTSDPVEAFECLCLASLLMRMLEAANVM